MNIPVLYSNAAKLLDQQVPASDPEVQQILAGIGFTDQERALTRVREMCTSDGIRKELTLILPTLLQALTDAATPDGSLINFERFINSVSEPEIMLNFLTHNPRAVEILVRLFVGSQFLTEILLKNPDYLERLTRYNRIAEFKSQQQFYSEAMAAARQEAKSTAEIFDILRRFQRWELLRIGACDTFGLMDLKNITVQLSLLADGLVQTCLTILSEELNLPLDDFAVLAFGKLGGEELNYSSDIDLVFIAGDNSTQYWQLGQRLIKSLMESTSEGFLYRVDMRLRPWGRSGALVTTVDAYVDYFARHGRLWEKQAMLKARVIAGNQNLGINFFRRIEPQIFNCDPEEVRKNVLEMKQRIEAELKKKGKDWGEVKSGKGSIRDVEFTTQYLQMANGAKHPSIRSINTLDGLVRLVDHGLIQADEYRHLTSGYVFFRKIEHALQLMHYNQEHHMPTDERELAYLARRLDFQEGQQLVQYYEQHRKAVRNIFKKYIHPPKSDSGLHTAQSEQESNPIGMMAASYSKVFNEAEIEKHSQMARKLSETNNVELQTEKIPENQLRLTMVGFDQTGDLSLICGLLFVYGFDIQQGHLFTNQKVNPAASSQSRSPKLSEKSKSKRKFVIVLDVKASDAAVQPSFWISYKKDLTELLNKVETGKIQEAVGELAKRVAGALHDLPQASQMLYPVEIELDNDTDARYTILRIQSEDTIGFLYELTNALSMSGIDIARMVIDSEGNKVSDVLYVTDDKGEKISAEAQQQGLRAAIVLIKHFTHLLPRSPNPESALLHFREFLEHLFKQPNWVEEISSLERTSVLSALARLLGVSDFLWEDFLRLQHSNLFPVVANVEELKNRVSFAELKAELARELAEATSAEDQQERLNAFKDRAMLRTDMRHILGHISEFGQFSDELTDVAEVVVQGAYEICDLQLQERYGVPRLETEDPCRISICALGKCGGRELGFASDIELMFIYEGSGQTTGPEIITNNEYYLKLVEKFSKMIKTRSEGIFQIDLRLRPYGQAGSLAVSAEAFQSYFSHEGAAWPYERQALVKLRPIAADEEFGNQIVRMRDSIIYSGKPFDVAAMLAMREKQIQQLVKGGTINAKLGDGGLVDCEYLIQSLQITYGHRNPGLRTTNTLEGIDSLKELGLISPDDYVKLRNAYIFLRRLIDALRMVRGNAKDLTVPPQDQEEFDFLARRLGYGSHTEKLQTEISVTMDRVRDFSRLLAPIKAMTIRTNG
ncbi:[protein-PII] uridylyltransferase family protein [Gimesia maris]|uniref:Glutamate-ammonia-ligase adenylyltransferase n=2 Tax=Gimesia maris TaxID=122 RepID=A0ABX5YSW7_9PLAN|nr:glutamine synthetase adenylyltransferase [Gimesia maris]QEG18608.1 Glutamate-ammonia-ligase adenylyltransferase [Gimesia maris]QGQ28438.1 glutamine synthetase adenylyltransferase [Gimesia maris]